MRSTYQTKSNKEVVRKCQAMFVYFPWVMGRPGEPAETALDATGLCNNAKVLFANEVAGVGDGATYFAREYLMNGLLYAFEPRQPTAMLHEVSRTIGMWVMNLQYPGATPVSSNAYRKAAVKFWGHDKAWDLNTSDGKAMAAKRIRDRTYVKDS